MCADVSVANGDTPLTALMRETAGLREPSAQGPPPRPTFRWPSWLDLPIACSRASASVPEQRPHALEEADQADCALDRAVHPR